MKPVLSGQPLLCGRWPKSPNLFPLFTLNETFIKRTPLLSGRGHLKSTCTWNGHFYCCQPVLNGHFQLNSTTQHARHQKCERLPRIATHKFSIFTLKNVFWQTYLLSFTVQYCFVFRFVCIELVSLIWFLQINFELHNNLCLWYYDQFVHFDKEINANVYSHSLWEYSKHFHCSFEWNLTPHMMLSTCIETCIRRTPCIKQRLQHSLSLSAYYRLHCILKLSTCTDALYKCNVTSVALITTARVYVCNCDRWEISVMRNEEWDEKLLASAVCASWICNIESIQPKSSSDCVYILRKVTPYYTTKQDFGRVFFIVFTF